MGDFDAPEPPPPTPVVPVVFDGPDWSKSFSYQPYDLAAHDARVRAEERAAVRAELLELIELMDTPANRVDWAAVPHDVHAAWPRKGDAFVVALADYLAPEPTPKEKP